MQQPGYGGPLPQEVAMGPPDVQGMTPQNVPQGYPTYPQQTGYVGPAPPYGMPTGQPGMTPPYIPQGPQDMASPYNPQGQQGMAPPFVPQGQQGMAAPYVPQAHAYIMQQPGYAGPPGMAMGQMGGQTMAPPGCPPGLHYLTMVDQLLIKQKVEVLEVVTGIETANKYEVLNSMGQHVYKAKEDSDCCTRYFCSSNRCLEMNITDLTGQEVIHLNRPLRCDMCCFPCCLQEMEVSSPPGTIIGTISQQWSIFNQKLLIKDEMGRPVFRIEGPCWTGSCCGSDVEFKVLCLEKDEQVGKITKQWTGLAEEMFTDADNFGINFPLDLDVKLKATLLGALFLIDYMFFEETENNDG